MEYCKKALTFEEQADQLLKRGLEAERNQLIARLEAVSYYRLSGYLYPFRKEGTDQFMEGTSLSEVWERYCFDRRLRVLVLDAIERVEVAVRTRLVYRFSHSYGPFGYCDDANVPKLSIDSYLEWRTSLQEETKRSKEAFKKHFYDKYGDVHRNLPLWMLAELMTMGSLMTFFKGVSPGVKRDVAADFDLPDELLLSWLRSLNATRNHCAHHARFWNRVLGYPPLLPNLNKFPEWHGENKLPNDRCGIILMICRFMLRKISPTSNWHTRLESLFSEYTSVPLVSMGLPERWREHPVWIKE